MKALKKLPVEWYLKVEDNLHEFNKKSSIILRNGNIRRGTVTYRKTDFSK